MLRKRVAEDVIAQLDLKDSNRGLAENWLSLWDGDALPPRARFNPAALKPFLAGVILFNVVPDRSVTVRLAGTGFRHVLGTELTGMDWIARAPESYRAPRMRLFCAIAQGAVGVGYRRMEMVVGDDYISEEILLPFAPEPDGSSTVIAHVNFKPEQFLQIKSLSQVTGDPHEFKLMTLT